MYDEEYDRSAAERNYAVRPLETADPAEVDRHLHVVVVDGYDNVVGGYDADPVATIEAVTPEHGQRLAWLIDTQPVALDPVDPDLGEPPAAVDERALAADIADLLSRGGYPIQPTAEQVWSALPVFLRALAKTSSDTALGVARLKLR